MVKKDEGHGWIPGYDCVRILRNLDGSVKADRVGVKTEWEWRKYCLIALLSEVFESWKGLLFYSSHHR